MVNSNPACYGLEVSRPSSSSPLTTWVNDLGNLLDAPPAAPDGLSSRDAAIVKGKVQAALARLAALAQGIDPVKLPTRTFNPSDPAAVGPFIGLAMLAQPRKPMAGITRFYGSGIYAIYYRGPFDAYGPISGSEHPIYVGKADPVDSKADTPQGQGTKLADRMLEHAKNIRKATTTLRIEDFDCRHLVITSGWQGSAESFLIRLYHPIWNSETRICHGLGKHGDADETRGNKRSPWDTLHPGRTWSTNSRAGDQFPEATIRANLVAHFAAKPPLRTKEDAFAAFFATLR